MKTFLLAHGDIAPVLALGCSSPDARGQCDKNRIHIRPAVTRRNGRFLHLLAVGTSTRPGWQSGGLGPAPGARVPAVSRSSSASRWSRTEGLVHVPRAITTASRRPGGAVVLAAR